MKKRLITSLILTLVIVLSMSTATFAWYSANKTATATISTVTAATSGKGNIVIRKVGETNYVPNLSVAVTDVLAPASLKLDKANWKGELTTASNWITATVAGETTTANDLGAFSGYVSVVNLELTNLSTVASDAITLTSSAKKPASAENVAAECAYIVEVINGDTAYYTHNTFTLTADGNVEGSSLTGVETVSIGTMAASAVYNVNVYAWFDGWDHVNANAGESFDISLTFTEA